VICWLLSLIIPFLPFIKEIYMPLTALTFVAHPDDAELNSAGLILRLIAEGARVYIIIATDGRLGTRKYDEESIVKIRAEEMVRSAHKLGTEAPVFLNYHDSKLDTLSPGILRGQFIRLIRMYRPDISISEDPFAPFEVHPDHRAVAWAAAEALGQSDLPLAYPEHLAEGLTPHYVPEKYLFGPALSNANKIVDITPFINKKVAAIAEHKSQLEYLAEGFFSHAKLSGFNTHFLSDKGPLNELDPLTLGVKTQAFRIVRFNPLIEEVLRSLNLPINNS
jgi:LmbE family N-acetylglucosaminyl deacetylase